MRLGRSLLFEQCFNILLRLSSHTSKRSFFRRQANRTTRGQHILNYTQTERKPVTTIKRIMEKSGHAARSHIFIEARLSLQCAAGF